MKVPGDMRFTGLELVMAGAHIPLLASSQQRQKEIIMMINRGGPGFDGVFSSFDGASFL